MSEPATKRQPIDLDEFERRLRGSEAAPRPAAQDPLAELARLVGTGKDPFAQTFDRSRAPSAASVAAQRPLRPVAAEQDWAPQHGVAADHGYDAPYDDHEPQRPVVGLRGALDETAGWHPGAPAVARAPGPRVQGYAQPQAYQNAYADPSAYAAEGEPAYQDEFYAPEGETTDAVRGRAGRGGRPLLLLGSALGVILLGLGATFLLRSGPIGSKGVPTILAAAGPNKIQPPQADKANSASVPSILDKDNADKNGPVHVVSQREEPVDLSQAAPQAAAAPDPSAYPFGIPRRVHTIAVRPDGTFITDPATASAPQAPAQVASLSGNNSFGGAPAGEASAPPPAPAPAPAPAKMPTRVVPVQHSRAQSAGEAGGPMQLGAASRPVAPVRAPTRVASQAAEAPVASAGSYDVQLAAAGSESEARSRMNEFARRYGSKFRGHHLTFHKGESNGRTVWRVRLTGMSQEEAIGICSDVKTAGGACFVARD